MFQQKIVDLHKREKRHAVLKQDEFLEGINQKKARAWEELYRYFYGALCNYATGITSDDAVAENIVQECFITIWKSNLHFQQVKALSVYLYRSVHNNALKHLRDKFINDSRLKEWSEEQDEVEDCDFYLAVEEDLIRKLQMAISELPEQRRTILLLAVEGCSTQEIANRLKISINTVKTQKKRAYFFLKERLQQNYMLFLLLGILQ